MAARQDTKRRTRYLLGTAQSSARATVLDGNTAPQGPGRQQPLLSAGFTEPSSPKQAANANARVRTVLPLRCRQMLDVINGETEAHSGVAMGRARWEEYLQHLPRGRAAPSHQCWSTWLGHAGSVPSPMGPERTCCQGTGLKEREANPHGIPHGSTLSVRTLATGSEELSIVTGIN